MSKEKYRPNNYVSEILGAFRHSRPGDYKALKDSLEGLSPTSIRRVYVFTRGYKDIIESALGSPDSAVAIIGRIVESLRAHKKDKGDLSVPLEIELGNETILTRDDQRPNRSIIHEMQYNGTPKNQFDDHDCTRQ
ncbi:MAG: hypothetical protein AABX96_01635 [Nanoarchaeota archaeon]